MITKEQALEFIYELSKEFKITINLIGNCGSFLEVYSDTSGTFHFNIEADSLEELVTKFIANYINTALLEDLKCLIPVDIDMLEVGQTYRVELDDWYDGDHTVHILKYTGKEGDFYTFETRGGYFFKYEDKDFLQLWKIQEGAHD